MQDLAHHQSDHAVAKLQLVPNRSQAASWDASRSKKVLAAPGLTFLIVGSHQPVLRILPPLPCATLPPSLPLPSSPLLPSARASGDILFQHTCTMKVIHLSIKLSWLAYSTFCPSVNVCYKDTDGDPCGQSQDDQLAVQPLCRSHVSGHMLLKP